MVVVGLDIGTVRIGVAVSDPSGTLASPRQVIRRSSNAAAIAAIARVVDETHAQRVVVGLPVSFDGQLHGQAKSVQAFAAKLRARLSVELVYADESLSTVRAEEAMRTAGVRPDRLHERIDAAAAAVILQDYLDQQRVEDRAADITDHTNAWPESEGSARADERGRPGI